jgi:hypothetical protein
MTKLAVRTCLAALAAAGIVSLAAGRASAWQDKVQWKTNLFQSFVKARDEQKPLVVYFYKVDPDSMSERMDYEKALVQSSQINSLASQAIFAWVDREKDDANRNVEKMATSLDLTEFPVIVVLDAKPDNLDERGRIAGYQDISDIETKLSELVAGVTSTPAEPPADTPLTQQNLPGFLKGLGYSPEEISEGFFEIKVERPAVNWTVFVQVWAQTSNRRVWCLANLGKLENLALVPADKLAALLNRNDSIGPSHFYIHNDVLYLGRALENRQGVEELFPAELEIFVTDVIESNGIWKAENFGGGN